MKSLLQGNAIFEEFKGALAEQYVLQQLKCIEELPVYYWSAERATAEVDFLVQRHGEVIPIEVKAEENLKAKSLRTYYDKFNPANCVRTSMADYRREQWLTNVPLYAIGSYLSGDTIHPGA
jgi:predicted AAA+ superfamily ATPase